MDTEVLIDGGLLQSHQHTVMELDQHYDTYITKRDSTHTVIHLFTLNERLISHCEKSHLYLEVQWSVFALGSLTFCPRDCSWNRTVIFLRSKSETLRPSLSSEENVGFFFKEGDIAFSAKRVELKFSDQSMFVC